MIFRSINGEIVADSDTYVISIRPCYDKTKSAQKFIHYNAEGQLMLLTPTLPTVTADSPNPILTVLTIVILTCAVC